MIVTTVLLVRDTSLTAMLGLTTASHPVASAWAESKPSMMAWRCPLNAPPLTQVSSVKVRIIVDPPVRMSASLSLVTVPVSVASVATVILNVGVATSALDEVTSAEAGTVASMVS